MSFTLEYPVDLPIINVVLPSPQPGDINRVDLRMVLNQSRSGEQLISRPEWRPTQLTESFSFVNMTRAVKDSLMAFWVASLADVVLVTDHNGNSYTAVISTSIPDYITERDNCSYSVSFDLINTETELNVINSSLTIVINSNLTPVIT